LAKISQVSARKPNAVKNVSFAAPYRCKGLSKYSKIFPRSTINRLAFGNFIRAAVCQDAARLSRQI
jgi:hypothetical protein